jgi:hypothetical protein
VPDRIAQPNKLLASSKAESIGRFLVYDKPTSDENESTAKEVQSIVQIEQVPVSNVPVETYVGETDTHHAIILRTLPGTEVDVHLEGRVLVIKGTLPSLAIPKDVRLLANAINTFEKRLTFSNEAQINPNECTMGEPSDAGAIIIKIGKFQSRKIGSITVGSSKTPATQPAQPTT